MSGGCRSPGSPPEHLLDLRARVRLRHTLVDARREWQQRMQAVLYHHGVPSRSWLMTAESRAWLARLALPTAAREQLTIALAMIDAHDAQLVPLDQELRNYAKRQPGCRALMRHYGLDRSRRSRSSPARRRAPLQLSREAVRYAGLDINRPPIRRRGAPGHLSRQGPPALRWALSKRQCALQDKLARPRVLTAGSRRGSVATALPRRRAQAVKRSYHTLRDSARSMAPA